MDLMIFFKFIKKIKNKLICCFAMWWRKKRTFM